MSITIKILTKAGFLTLFDKGLMVHPSAVGESSAILICFPNLVFIRKTAASSLNENIKTSVGFIRHQCIPHSG